MSDTQAFVPPVTGTGPSAVPAGPASAAAGAGHDPATAVPVLEVSGLVTRYPVRRALTDAAARRPRRWVRAVDGVSFTLQRGEMMALVGESGCGKTSTVQTILGMVKPAGGLVRLNGTPITGLADRQMRPMRRTGAVWDELIRNFYRQDAKSAMV